MANVTRVLLVCANPRGTDALRIGEEDRALRESIRLSPHRDCIEVESIHAATIDDFRRRLLERPRDIVHFSGHGTHSGLLFEDANGRVAVPSSEALAEHLQRRRVSTVILNACYSVSVGRLAAIGTDFTIASSGPIADPAAVEFTRGFYDAIGAGLEVPDAFAEGVSCAKLKGFSPPVVLLRKGEQYIPSKVAVAGAAVRSAPPPETTESLLLGIALDTSGSMQDNIYNNSGRRLSRLESVEAALEGLGAKIEAQLAGHPDCLANFRVFIYAFGIRAGSGVADMISMVRAARVIDLNSEIEKRRIKYEAEASQSASAYGGLASLARQFGYGSLVDATVDAITSQVKNRIVAEVGQLILNAALRIGDSTATARELTELWKTNRAGASAENVEPLIYGDTPMRAAAEQIAARLKRERPTDSERRILLVISDGEPTDGNPTGAFDDIRKAGVDVVSCFVTDADLVDPRVLWREPQPGWTHGARLMWEIASPIDEAGPFAKFLLDQGWQIEPGAKLFVQANHSTVVEEFFSVAGSHFSDTGRDFLPRGR
jgi:hypothetical protein